MFAAPIIVIVDWFLAPSVPPPSRTSALWWLTFPLLWVTYTVIRGLIVDWYPYPFIDPRDDVEHAAGSWSAVIATTLALTMFVIALALLIQSSTARLAAARAGDDQLPPGDTRPVS